MGMADGRRKVEKGAIPHDTFAMERVRKHRIATQQTASAEGNGEG